MKIKSFFSVVLGFSLFSVSCTDKIGDKANRPSPPASARANLSGDLSVSINYSSPSLKGRLIGSSVEPMNHKIWRAGANEATVFDFNKNATVNGQPIAAGKYAFFIIQQDSVAELIFNRIWDTWGAYDYEKNKAENALSVSVPITTDATSLEKLAYTIDSSGLTRLQWGRWVVSFIIK
jgi:hypothetical protein